MNKNIIKYVINIGMLIAFILVFITGVIKFPMFSSFFLFVYRTIPGYLISKVHNWSGLVTGILVLAHLIFIKTCQNQKNERQKHLPPKNNSK